MSLAQTETTPGSGNPGQAIPGTGGVSAFAGSVPAKLVPGVIPLSLQDAINRGLKQNLGLLLSHADIGSARGQRWEQLSALLPHVTAAPYVDASKINLPEIGLSSFPGVTLPRSIGPFSYFDARAAVTQTLFDWKSVNATRAASQSLKSAAYTFKDARDLVVLAVGYVYLQAIADEARIETAEAQVKTAQALYDQASDQINAGTSPDIDGLRTKVELQNRQQQLIQAKNNLAIQKLTVARVIGLAPGQEFEFTDKSPYQAIEATAVDEVLGRAYASRSDFQAAMRDVRAAEFARKAAVAGYLPSLSFNADYGLAGSHPSTATSVADVRGTLSIPIFQGGSVHADVLQADARLEQSRERLENLRWFSRAIVSAPVSPIPWKWCNRKRPSRARTNSTFRVSTTIITRKYRWFALWASLSRVSRNFSKESKHGGRKPTPYSRCVRRGNSGRSISSRPIFG
jgi:outer membrane protein TolC